MKAPSQRRQDAATLLHELFCRWDHTEGCAWFYESDRAPVNCWKGGTTHAKYLAVADDLLMRFNDAQGCFIGTLRWLKVKKDEGNL